MARASEGAAGKARKGAAKPLHRPLSPHLQIWRWHVTMLGSILNRVAGVGLYVGAFLVTAWLVCLAAGPLCYAAFLDYAAHPLALVLWVGFSGAAFYHLASGVRHLIWDAGVGLSPAMADVLTTLSIWFAVIATATFWGFLYLDGRIVL